MDCRILGRLLNLLVPQFLCPGNRDDNSTYLRFVTKMKWENTQCLQTLVTQISLSSIAPFYFFSSDCYHTNSSSPPGLTTHVDCLIPSFS